MEYCRELPDEDWNAMFSVVKAMRNDDKRTEG